MGFFKLSSEIFWQNSSSLAGFQVICYANSGTDLPCKLPGKDLKSTIYLKTPGSFLGGMVIRAHNLGAGRLIVTRMVIF